MKHQRKVIPPDVIVCRAGKEHVTCILSHTAIYIHFVRLAKNVDQIWLGRNFVVYYLKPKITSRARHFGTKKRGHCDSIQADM